VQVIYFSPLEVQDRVTNEVKKIPMLKTYTVFNADQIEGLELPATNEERTEIETIESLAEPFLVRMGFLARTPRGRVATAAGWAHLGIKPPLSAQVGTDASLFDQDPDIAQ
jgi:Holliday junction resolvasome RuvABC ATP-dependent DNA helicase subunit